MSAVATAYKDLVQEFTGEDVFTNETAKRYWGALDRDPRAVAAHFAALAGTTLEALESES